MNNPFKERVCFYRHFSTSPINIPYFPIPTVSLNRVEVWAIYQCRTPIDFSAKIGKTYSMFLVLQIPAPRGKTNDQILYESEQGEEFIELVSNIQLPS